MNELAELRAENARLREENARIPELEAQIAALVETVATLSKIVYGDSSERTKHKPSRQADDAESQEGTGSADPQRTKPKRGRKKGDAGHGRRDYGDLETEEVIHDLDDDDKCCKECSTAFEPFGYESCEQIDWLVKLVRIVHKRLRYRRNCKCSGPGMVIAPVVPKPIGKGRFTSGFLSRLIIEKYCFGTPLNRIVANLALSGAELSTGTLTGSLQSCSMLLEPLAKAIAVHNATAAHLHIDETSWKVYEQIGDKKGNRCWLWVFVGPDSTVFNIDPTRSLKPLADHLGVADNKLPDGHEVIVSSDFLSVYQSMNNNVDGFKSLLCWAHIRRYFIRAGDAHKELQIWRDEWVSLIGDLYQAHQLVNQATYASVEYNQATQRFAEVLGVMDETRKHQSQDESLHIGAKKVLATLDNEWAGLTAHQDHLELPMDNNAAERAIRGPVVGRKNYNGSGSKWSADLAGRAWTITATAKQHGLNQLTYLNDYFDDCGNNGAKPLRGEQLQRFLPWNASEHDLARWRGP